MDSLTKEIETLHTQVAVLTQERDAAVAIIEQTLCGISFGELRKAYAAYRAGEKYETVVDRIDAELTSAQARIKELRETLEQVVANLSSRDWLRDVAQKALALPAIKQWKEGT